MNPVVLVKNLLFPKKCILCGAFLPDGIVDLCDSCRKTADSFPYGYQHPAPKGKNQLRFLDSYTAVWYYKGYVRNSIQQFKFRGRVSNAAGYARMIGMKLLEEGPFCFDLLTWVPISFQRKMRRGYDQCRAIAECLGKELDFPAKQTLQKTRHNPPQSGLKETEARKNNVTGVYRIRRSVDVAGKVIVLIDDVFTTGSTADECARVLLEAGAKEVHCAVVAAAQKER